MDIQAYSENTKLREWARMVSACKSSGLTVPKWCSEQGLNVKTYYYRHKQVMRALEQVQPCDPEKPVRFTELIQPKGSVSDPAAVIEAGNIRIQITNHATGELLEALIRTLTRVC